VRGKLRSTTTAAAVTGTYIVCLDCGREFPYDWSQMKMLASTPRTGWAPTRATIIPGLKVAGDRCRALRGASTSASGPSNGLVVSWAGNGSPAPKPGNSQLEGETP